MTQFPRSEIFVTAFFEGFHCWPDAPQEVAFLRNLHRHVFNVKVWHDVGHNDRQVEFFILKGEVIQCLKFVRDELTANPHMSCEMIAEGLSRYLMTYYKRTPSRIEISEDGENGSITYFGQ